jgi:methylthioribose-1-phosphate isomerase
MKIHNTHYHTIWVSKNNSQIIQIIDQRYLPFQFVVQDLKTAEDMYKAIKEMWVRGAPLIGVAAAYGMYLGLLEMKNEKKSNKKLSDLADYLKSARPTGVNLQYAVNLILKGIKALNSIDEKINTALQLANEFKDQEIENCRLIGTYGLPLIEEISQKRKGETVNILTHCNAGWLACIDYGTATAPIYLAHQKGIKVHVWVDETRPRNQGARLTAYELGQEEIPHTVITDNTGGLLMQKGMVDMVIVGSDRTTASGDVANKIGTYLKALAAFDNQIPFYVALPLSTIDWEIDNGLKEITIEERNQDEVKFVEGWYKNKITSVSITPEKSNAVNYGFDITPAKYVTALITENGICKAEKEEIEKLKKV